jgi:hypothetical protein
MTRGTTVKMIQLSALTLLLAAGLSGTARANTPTAEPSQPVVESVSSTPQPELAQPKQPQDHGKTYYVWDRVGKPIGKESFFI